MRVWFDHAAGLVANDGGRQCFEIAGADRKYIAGESNIDNETVVVSSSEVREPWLCVMPERTTPHALCCSTRAGCQLRRSRRVSSLGKFLPHCDDVSVE